MTRHHTPQPCIPLRIQLVIPVHSARMTGGHHRLRTNLRVAQGLKRTTFHGWLNNQSPATWVILHSTAKEYDSFGRRGNPSLIPEAVETNLTALFFESPNQSKIRLHFHPWKSLQGCPKGIDNYFHFSSHIQMQLRFQQHSSSSSVKAGHQVLFIICKSQTSTYKRALSQRSSLRWGHAAMTTT